MNTERTRAHRTKVLIVDDHPVVCAGLTAVLGVEPDIEIVGVAADGQSAVAQAELLSPDVVVMDVALPRLSGVEATRRIRALRPDIKVIGLSAMAERGSIQSMFDAGATGYLLKSAAADDLVAAVRVVSSGARYLCPALAAIHRDLVGGDRADLTARERDVLALIVEGKTSKEIAAALGIAVTTVETHRRQLTGRLGIHTIAELTKYAIRHGLTSVD